MKRYSVLSIILLCIVFSAFLLKTLHDAGQFKEITPRFNGEVKRVSGITGCEDITIDHEKRVAYLSADDRFATLHGAHGFGGLYVLPLDSDNASPRLLNRIPQSEIHPHGISYYKSPEGQGYLYVVDHAGSRHSILLYHFLNDSTLSLLKTFGDPDFIISPNDVAAVNERKFYFTNDHGSPSSFGKKLEEYLQLKRSNLVYFNGNEFSIAAGNIAYCNGINLNKSRDEVYVASSVGKSILVFKRDTGNGILKPFHEIALNTGVDNIELDEQENLWTAAHPKLLTFVKHAQDTSHPSPSQVIRITRSENGDFLPEEIYMNAGEEISASSVAAVSGNMILIGAVLDGHFLICEMH